MTTTPLYDHHPQKIILGIDDNGFWEPITFDEIQGGDIIQTLTTQVDHNGIMVSETKTLRMGIAHRLHQGSIWVDPDNHDLAFDRDMEHIYSDEQYISRYVPAFAFPKQLGSVIEGYHKSLQVSLTFTLADTDDSIRWYSTRDGWYTEESILTNCTELKVVRGDD